MSTTTPQKRRLVRLVACGGSKLDREAPARELYTGDLTRKAIAYAETRGATMIVSARYGLVGLDETIAPYEQRIDKLTAGERADWGAMIVEQLGDAGLIGGVLLVHAGAAYVAALREAVAGTRTVVTSTFMRPTEIGDRKAFYKRDAVALAARRAA